MKHDSQVLQNRHQRKIRVLLIAIIALTGVAIVLPFFIFRFPDAGGSHFELNLINTHDLTAAVAVMENFDKGLRSGIFYPRWLPEINYGYGVATMIFYPPGVFYLSSFVHLFAPDWIVTLLIVCAASSAASGLALYGLARLFLGKTASVLAAIFYILIPYHVLDLYWRGALPEFVGFAFLPVIVYLAHKLANEGALRYYAGTGLVYGVYLMTHLPVGYLFTYALALYAVLWAIQQRNLRIALRIAGGMSLGLMLSAIYWLPAAMETKEIYEPVTDIFPYHQTYITLIPGGGAFDQLVNSVFSYQALALITIIFVIHSLRRIRSGNNQRIQSEGKTPVRLWEIMAVTGMFMSCSLSIHVSRLIPKIQIAVPPWRWLAIASLFTCLLAGEAVQQVISNISISELRLWLLRSALAITIILNVVLSFGSIIKDAPSNGMYKKPENFVTAGFVPRAATLPDSLPRTANIVVSPSDAVVETTRWDPQRREFVVRADQPSQIRIKTYYFPGWTANIDGQKTDLGVDSDGIQLLSLDEGRHFVQVKFVDTFPRIAGKVIFGIALLTIGGFAGFDYVRIRSHRSLSPPSAEEATSDRSIRSDLIRTLPKSRVLVIASGIVLLVLAGVLLTELKSPKPKNASEGKSIQPATSGEPILTVPGLDSIPVATGEADLDQVIAAIASRDPNRVDDLVRAGKAFRAKSNSRVRIIRTAFGKTNIRILEGDSITMEGWVPERWIKQ